MTNSELTDVAVQPLQVNAAITNFYSYFENHASVIKKLPYHQIEQVADELYRAYEDGRRVFLFVNGGSAALASHLACDLGKATTISGKPQQPCRVLSLTHNTALITA